MRVVDAAGAVALVQVAARAATAAKAAARCAATSASAAAPVERGSRRLRRGARGAWRPLRRRACVRARRRDGRARPRAACDRAGPAALCGARLALGALQRAWRTCGLADARRNGRATARDAEHQQPHARDRERRQREPRDQSEHVVVAVQRPAPQEVVAEGEPGNEDQRPGGHARNPRPVRGRTPYRRPVPARDHPRVPEPAAYDRP